jgi:hypothetical protein
MSKARNADAGDAHFSLSEAESLVPIAIRTYDDLMAELRALLPGREADAFKVMLALLYRCQQHAEAREHSNAYAH